MPRRRAQLAAPPPPEESTITVDNSDIDPALIALTDAAASQASLLSDSLATTTPTTPFIPPDDPPTENELLQASAPLEKFSWSLAMHAALLETLCDQCRLGKRSDSGFKKEAWVAVISTVQEAYLGSHILTEVQVRSKGDWYKAMWKEWVQLDDNSGFGWEESTQLHTASDDVWKRYITVRCSYESYIRI